MVCEQSKYVIVIYVSMLDFGEKSGEQYACLNRLHRSTRDVLKTKQNIGPWP